MLLLILLMRHMIHKAFQTAETNHALHADYDALSNSLNIMMFSDSFTCVHV